MDADDVARTALAVAETEGPYAAVREACHAAAILASLTAARAEGPAAKRLALALALRAAAAALAAVAGAVEKGDAHG